MSDISTVTVLSILGSVASIVGLFLPANSWKTRVSHAVYGLVIVALAVLATSYANKLNRVHRVQRAAAQIVASRRTNYSELGYIQAVLAFLEANKQLYPDSYARALKMCEAYNCYGTDAAHLQHAYSMIELASAMDGILKGIAAVEGADNAPRSD